MEANERGDRLLNELKYPTLLDHIPEDNFLFAVLGTDSEAFYQVIMEHYFCLRHYYKPQFNSIDIDYEDNKKWNAFNGLDVVYLAEDYVRRQQDTIVEVILDLLDSGYLLLTYVNEYYIPAYTHAYQKYHAEHTMLIGEYVSENDSYICQDYFSKQYGVAFVAKSDLLNAIKNMRETNCMHNSGVVALKRKENYTYTFRPIFFLQQLNGMLNTFHNQTDHSYGIGLFDAEKSVLLNNSPIWRPNTFRGLYQLLFDNIELMKYRIHFLYKHFRVFDKERFINACIDIQAKCKLYRNIFLKIELRDATTSITIPKDGYDIGKFIFYLDDIGDKYVKLINDLIEVV